MPRRVDPFSDEQARLLINLEQRYQVWMDAERILAALPYDLRRKEISGRSYLYEINDRSGNGKSLGAWSPENDNRLTTYRAQKAAAKQRRDTSRQSLDEASRLYRALRLPMLASDAGPILRESDRRRLLGSHLVVVGTNAMVAYAIEAGGFIRDVPDETQDFDMTWSATEPEREQTVWHLLKAVDPTFTVNSERTFQARNAKAYEVEILVAPSRAATMFRTDQPSRPAHGDDVPDRSAPAGAPARTGYATGCCRGVLSVLPRAGRFSTHQLAVLFAEAARPGVGGISPVPLSLP